MCGLVGIYSSNMLNKHKEVLASMLYLDTWRGRDSTGVAAIRHNADTAVLKSTVPGYEFVEGPKLEHHLKLNDFCWIGHNRYGTVGRNIKTNAHPFTVDDEAGACLLVGAHNGTLKDKYVLTDAVKYGTDSEALFNEIVRIGLEKALEKVEGAWALTFYDHDKEELRFVRNKERPLFYAFEKGKKTLFWASEQWMIRVACSRAGVELQDDKVYSFAEDTLYSFPAPMKVNEELTFERKGGVVGKKTPTFFRDWDDRRWIGGHSTPPHEKTASEAQTTSQTQRGPTVADSTTQSGTNVQNSGVKQTHTNDSSSGGISNEQPDDKVRDILSAKKFKGYKGVSLTKKELDDQLENGCSWCELEFVDPNDRYAWLAPSKPVCSKCLDGVLESDNKDSSSKVACH